MSSVHSKFFASLVFSASLVGFTGVAMAGDGDPPPGGGGGVPGDRVPGPRAVAARATHDMRTISENTCRAINASAAEAVQRITVLRVHHAPADAVAAAHDAAIARINTLATEGAARIEHVRTAALARLATMDDATDADDAAVNAAAQAATGHITECRDHARTLVNNAVTRTLPPPSTGGPRP